MFVHETESNMALRRLQGLSKTNFQNGFDDLSCAGHQMEGI